jgi:hypothetical protein
MTIASNLSFLQDNTGTVVVPSTATSTSSIAGSALQVAGGVGIGGNLYVVGQIYSTGGIVGAGGGTSGPRGPQGPSGTGPQGPSGASGVSGPAGVSGPTGAAVYGGPSGPEGPTGPANFFGGTITNPLNIANNTAAVSTATGALVVQGGVGLGGNLYVGGKIFSISTTTGAISALSQTPKVTTSYTPGSLTVGYSSYTTRWYPINPISVNQITARVLTAGTQAVGINININDNTAVSLAWTGTNAYTTSTGIATTSSNDYITVIVTNTGLYAADMYVSFNYI